MRRILPKVTHVSWYSVAVTNFTAAPGLEETAAEMTRSVRDILAHSGPYPFKRSDALNAETVEIDSRQTLRIGKPVVSGFLLSPMSVKRQTDGWKSAFAFGTRWPKDRLLDKYTTPLPNLRIDLR